MRRRPAAAPNAPQAGGRSPSAAGRGSEDSHKASLPKVVELPPEISVRDLAKALRLSPIDIIKELMNSSVLVSINQVIDYETAEIVAAEMGFETRLMKVQEPEKPVTEGPPKTLRQRLAEAEPAENCKPRPPVVTVLGHVDHGKTTLLDAIRETNVVAGESGGITQHIGAYQVDKDGRRITFLDTPGHEAFTAMRARGAQVTDLAVLVVAADDGVMPQTREAIDHARAAGVPILVALNKMDKQGAQPDRVKQQLADLDLTVEDWGGDVVCVPVSAKMKQGIDELLENILLVTDVAELRSNPDRLAVGTVIEGRLDKQRGATATLLIQAGSLHVGDPLLIGDTCGRVRAMLNDKGQPVDEATPSMPVLVLGLSQVPKAGDIFEVVESERQARAVAAERSEVQRQAAAQPGRPKSLSLDDIFERFQTGQVRGLNLILKADVQGSLEPIVNSLRKLGTDDLRVEILHQGMGNINESDVTLAFASQAIIIGFHVQVDEAARRLALQHGVDIRQYDIIYRLVDDVAKALKGMLEPVYADVTIGHAQVRQVFRISRRGNIAGCIVTDGEATRNALVRVLRDDKAIFEGRVDSLKRFKEDTSEVKAGFECGIGITGFDDIQEGDVLEFYKKERVS
ncbi:MAG: translation initiation factor IF-2 [Anaerolineae bacterium]|nr:translation initiation factor IF-2 [Anaerolineae bacterium]